MSRLNAGLDILQMIIDLEQQIEEFKQLQRVGSDVVGTEKISTAATWDFDETAPAARGNDITQTFTLRYTPSNPIDDKPPAAFNLVFKSLITGDYIYIDSMRLSNTIRRKKVTNPLHQEWAVSCTAQSGFGTPIRYRAKFYALTTGKGTLTVV